MSRAPKPHQDWRALVWDVREYSAAAQAYLGITAADKNAVYDQSHYRWAEDTGTEGSPTWDGTEDVAAGIEIYSASNVTKLVRFKISQTESSADLLRAPSLKIVCQRNGTGGYVNISTLSTYLSIHDSSVLTDGNNATELLTTGTNFISTNYGQIDNGSVEMASAIAVPQNQLSCWEVVVAVTFLQAGMTNNDTYDFRLVHGASSDQTEGTALNNYTGGAGYARAKWVVPPTLVQTDFRIRASGGQQDAGGVAPTSDTGWEAAENVSVTTDFYDQEFRIRFAIANTGASFTGILSLRSQKNGTGGYTLLPNAATPWALNQTQNAIAAVPSAVYVEPVTLTTSLLSGTGTYSSANSQAVEDNATASITIAGGNYVEVEFCILIRKASNDGYLVDGDYYDFRVYADGVALDTYTNTPRVTLQGSSRGIIGGTFAETPGRSWAVDNDGNVYAAIEMCDNAGGTYQNELVIVKSTNNGQSWVALDLANRPGTTYGDVEAVDMVFVEDEDQLKIIWQRGVSGDSVYHMTYTTASHPTEASRDKYGTVEAVDTGVALIWSQAVSIAYRPSDNVTWVAYKDGDGTNARVSLKKRTSGGTWDTSPTDLDSTASVGVGGAFLVMDSTERIHIIYAALPGGASDADLWHKSISTGDSLSGRTQVNDAAQNLDGDSVSHEMPMTYPKIYTDGATEKIGLGFVEVGDLLYFTHSPVSSISFGTDEQVTTLGVYMSGGGSGQAVADLVWDDVDDEAVAYWADETDFDMMTDERVSGSWGSDTDEVSNVNVPYIRADVWTEAGGDRVVGIMWSDHPTPGGTGGVQYRRVLRAAASTGATPYYYNRLLGYGAS